VVSGHGEGLAERLAGLTGMSPPAAGAVVDDPFGTWERCSGPAKGAAMTHRFGYGLIGTLLAVAGLAGSVNWALGRRAGGGTP
jgi:hypothetical protein